MPLGPRPEDSAEVGCGSCLSVLLAIGWVVIAVGANVTLLTALGMLLGGLLLQGGSNLLAVAALKSALQGKAWALAVASSLWPLVPVAISLYLAGLFTLIIQGCRSLAFR